MNDDKRTADLLYGVPAVAAYLSMRERQARGLLESGKIPSFHMGKTVCASKSAIDDYLSKIQAEAVREARKREAARD